MIKSQHQFALLKRLKQGSMMTIDRSIRCSVDVQASLNDVWEAWTTREGIISFFAPDCHVELKIDEAYEIFFNPSAPPGKRGSDEMRILAFQPEVMLSFTWNAPLHLPDVRKQHTHVCVYFEAIKPERTRVTLIHDGWGRGGNWDQAFDYFSRAWGRIVLPYLQYRFREGPIDWENPPEIDK